MKKFSAEQISAINTVTQHTAVIAGAGSGKTTVLVERIKTLLSEGVEPSQILAITFTRKAAGEMSERINRSDLTIKTFDAFCYEVVSEHLQRDIYIVNKSPFKDSEIVLFNNYDVNLRLGEKPKLYDDYVAFKEEENKLDFNDIEHLALTVIKDKNLSFDYILIDEFQDTNLLQYKIFKNLINDKTKTFIVGDPDQSIYGFRGANFKLLNRYIEEYNAKVLVLTNNYRSLPAIIEIANNLISYNELRYKKELVAFRKGNGVLYSTQFIDDEAEFNFVIKKYEELRETYNSFAILYRNNYQGFLYRNHFKDENNSDVLVTTIHQSKGLEFDVVFIIGVNKGILPDDKMNMKEQEEEERRLFFVGITRAKSELYLTSSKKANYNGIEVPQESSKFLLEAKKGATIIDKVKTKVLLSFEIGDKILHNKFGEGIVIKSSDRVIEVDFNGTIKKISVKYPGIEKRWKLVYLNILNIKKH